MHALALKNQRKKETRQTHQPLKNCHDGFTFDRTEHEFGCGGANLGAHSRSIPRMANSGSKMLSGQR